MQCCLTLEGLIAGSCRAADEEAGERESWTPWFATLSLLLCGRVFRDASAVEDLRSVLLRAVLRCIAWVPRLLWRLPAKRQRPQLYGLQSCGLLQSMLMYVSSTSVMVACYSCCLRH